MLYQRKFINVKCFAGSKCIWENRYYIKNKNYSFLVSPSCIKIIKGSVTIL